MTPFASSVTETREIGDITFTIRKLNDRKLREAAEKQFDRQIEIQAKFNSVRGHEPPPTPEDSKPATPKDLTPEQQAEAEAQELKTKRAARYASYDRDTVLRAGVKTWTGGDVKFSQTAIDDLDHEAAKALHEAILDLSLPALEPGAEETKRKND